MCWVSLIGTQVSIVGEHLDKLGDDMFFSAFCALLRYHSQCLPDFELGDGLDIGGLAIVVEVRSNDPLVVKNAYPSLAIHISEEHSTLSEGWASRGKCAIIRDRRRKDLILVDRGQAKLGTLVSPETAKVFAYSKTCRYSHLDHTVSGYNTRHISEDLVIQLFSMRCRIEISMEVEVAACDTCNGLERGHVQTNMLECQC